MFRCCYLINLSRLQKPESGPKEIAVFGPKADHGWTGAVLTNIQDKAKELNAAQSDYKYVVYSDADAEAQAKSVDDVLAKRRVLPVSSFSLLLMKPSLRLPRLLSPVFLSFSSTVSLPMMPLRLQKIAISPTLKAITILPAWLPLTVSLPRA